MIESDLLITVRELTKTPTFVDTRNLSNRLRELETDRKLNNKHPYSKPHIQIAVIQVNTSIRAYTRFKSRCSFVKGRQL